MAVSTASKKVEGPPSLRSLLARSPEIQKVSRNLATLALALVEQDGLLGVRQGEQLRRALAIAGDALGWSGTSDGAGYGRVGKDVVTIAKSGARAMAKDLAEELARKKTEMAQLAKTAASARKAAESPKTAYPVEFTYSCTVRDAFQNLVTKTDTLIANDAQEATSAADTLERNITGRTKLADLMIIDLQQKQEKVDAMMRTLPDFLESSHEVLGEVIANL